MEYQNWTLGEDRLVLNRLSLFEFGQTYAEQEIETDYCVQTERGSFYQIQRNGEDAYDLFSFDGDLESLVMSDCCVIATNHKEQFLLIYEKVSGSVYILDTRGILFLFTSIQPGERFMPGMGEIKCNKAEGCYDIDCNEAGFFRIYISEHDLLMLGNRADEEDELELNPDFKSFFEEEDEEPYLYLTYNGLKMKKVVSFLTENGVPFEPVPNLFKDDDETTNIRILLNQENLEMEQVQFLVARYRNCYSILGIPYEIYVGNMDVDMFQRKECMWEHVSRGSNKQSKKVCAILKTLRLLTDCRLDSILFHEYFRIIAQKMNPNLQELTDNLFCKLIIPSPKSRLDKEANKMMLLENVEYLKELKLPYTAEGIEGMNAKEAYKACVEAHRESNRNFKKVISSYEDKIVANKRIY